MDQPLYDVFFTGKLVEGADPDTARAGFAKLFKASPEAVEKFFNGKAQVLKRGVNKEEALKYKAALHKAGMMVAFKAHQTESPAPTQAAPGPAATPKPASTPTPAPSPSSDEEDWSLAPAGSDVLKPDERREIPERDIDTSAIKLVSAFATVEEDTKPAPPAPDTSHLSVAQVGEDLLTDKPAAPPPPQLDLESITLAPPGTELEELHDDLPPLNPDISGLSMAEVGADILEGQPKKQPPPPPNTDHIKVAE